MSTNNAEGQQEKKSRSKKPLAAVLLAALLGLGAYGGAKLYNNEANAPKEQVTIAVNNETVTVNNQEQKLAEGQTWEKWFEEYFSKKDMDKTEVVVDLGYGEKEITNEITNALSKLKISTTSK